MSIVIKELDYLYHIYENEYGYMDDLINTIGTNKTNKLIYSGMISVGYTEYKKTWKLTEFGKNYCEEVLE